MPRVALFGRLDSRIAQRPEVVYRTFVKLIGVARNPGNGYIGAIAFRMDAEDAKLINA